MNKKRYDLSQCTWRLKGTAPYVPLRENSMETGKPLAGITGWMPANVPGGVALALYRAGHIPHPYFGMNSLQCEWMENKWWIYETEVTVPEGRQLRLDFDGVDYNCAVYWNGQLLGEHTGMFEPFSFSITGLSQPGSKALLRVLIRHAPDEMGQIGKTSETFTQKSRFNYKWDFSTRLVNLGIWQKVWLTAWDGAELTDIFSQGKVLSSGKGEITVSARIFSEESEQRFRLLAECALDGKLAGTAEAYGKSGEQLALSLSLENPALWYPNGMGKQPLYQLKLQLFEGDTLLEETVRKVGVRTIALLSNENAPNEARPYLFTVNGQRMYVKGVNITPLDHIYGDVPKEQVWEILTRAKAMHCNLVRVWGGGLIETEDFYDCCDELGLLVWQEFIQSSSGIDNIPSEKPEFLALLRKSAEAAVKQKRNHPCLALWSGGNELMEANRTPCTEENPNIAMLQEIVSRLDPGRVFLPTSASGPNEFISKTPNTSHDVHGWWQYQGNPGHYAFYSGSDSLFHSEFGCDGMSSLPSLEKILPPEELRPVPMAENDLWRFHGDWWCTYRREEEIFGQWKDLRQYIACSQWMQAEGLRYILEANRRRAFRNSGSIIWQLNEPWPNISCTCLVEYHGRPKMAWYWAKDAFRPVHPVFFYQRLDYPQTTAFTGELAVFRDKPAVKPGLLTGEIFDLSGKSLFRRSIETLGTEGTEKLGGLSWQVPQDFSGIFLLRLTLEENGTAYTNHYYFSTDTQTPYQAALAEGDALSGKILSQKEGETLMEIANTGEKAALHICLSDRTDAFLLDMEENFFTLLPGEVRQITVAWRPKFPFGFDENTDPAPAAPMLQTETLSGQTLLLEERSEWN